MKQKLTKTQARQFVERWRAVNAFQDEELRARTMPEKFADLVSLFAWGQYLAGANRRAPKERNDVMKRWQKLRKAMQ